MKEDILKIINHYGLNHQLKYFQSEVFELNEAIVETTMKRREMEGKTPEIVEPTLETYITYSRRTCRCDYDVKTIPILL